MISGIQFIDKGDGMSLRDTVYKELKEAILRGDIVSGERLMEIPLATRLGVSRTPVREAIRRLEKEQLVVIIPGKGARVAGISDKEAMDALEVRLMIETMAAKLAAKNITKEQIEQLRDINIKIKNAADGGDIAGISELDNIFHRTISEASGNSILFTVARFLEGQVLRYRIEYIKRISDYNSMLSEHDAVIEAIQSGDGDRAADIIAVHIQKQKDAMGEIISKRKNNSE